MTIFEKNKAIADDVLDFIFKLGDGGLNPSDENAFEKWSITLAIYDTPEKESLLISLLAAALIRLKKLEARVQDSKDTSIERDLSE